MAFWLWFRDVLDEKGISIKEAERKGDVGNATIGYRARHTNDYIDLVFPELKEAIRKEQERKDPEA